MRLGGHHGLFMSVEAYEVCQRSDDLCVGGLW